MLQSMCLFCLKRLFTTLATLHFKAFRIPANQIFMLAMDFVHPLNWQKYRLLAGPRLAVPLLAACLAGFCLNAGVTAAQAQTSPKASFEKASFEKGFQPWLQSLWPQAQQAGVSRAVFDKNVASLKINWALPDLAVSIRTATKKTVQIEFKAPPDLFPPGLS